MLTIATRMPLRQVYVNPFDEHSIKSNIFVFFLSTTAVICSRPRFRFWMADIEGNVSHTYLLKDSVAKNSMIFEVPLLNPRQRKPVNIDDVYFGPCHFYLGKFIITYCESIVFIVNLELLKVIATVRRLRQIQYLAVSGDEIFIVEGGRSVVRIAMTQEPAILRNGFKYVQINGKSLLATESRIEVEEECVTQGDECFELPPIENIRLDIPLMCNITEHNLLRDDKLLLEHSRKMEVFEKLNELDYDDSILFEACTKRKKKMSADKAMVADKFNGIVEIGQQAELIDKQQSITNAKSIVDNSLVTPSSAVHIERIIRPSIMEASFCNGSGTLETQMEQQNLVEQHVPEIRSQPIFEAISNSTVDTTTTTTTIVPFKPIEFSYPVDVNPITNATPVKQAGDGMAKQRSIKSDTSDESQTIAKFPGLANMPKLWDISIEQFDGEHQSNGIDANGDDGNGATKEGIENDWVFL